MISENHHIYRQLSPLIILLLGILVIDTISLYEVTTLQSSTKRLLKKLNQLETESNVKISNLVRQTESCAVSIKRIERHGERMIDIIRNEFETYKMKMEEKLSKEKSDFNIVVKKLENVLTEQDNVRTMKEEKSDIEDKWLLVQNITVAFVLVAFTIFGGQFYSRGTQIDDLEKKIRYLTENKDKISLQYESLSIVEQIKRRQPEELENKFCVISFCQETHNKHRRITRPSVEGRLRIKKMDEADFVVTNDKSVLKIPHCKVILVFVDHNQKDVILGTPGEDEEDIKLLTVQACRKMGADVFVIYVGDRDMLT